MKKILTFIMLALLPMAMLTTVTSCGEDDEIVQPPVNIDGDNNGNSGQQSPEIIVTVDANGNADGGHLFTKIDESNFYIDDIKYTAVNGNLEVTGYNKAFFKGDATIISALKYEGHGTLKVSAIAKEAFYECETLKSIIIGNGLTGIGYSAFYGCTGLISVTIPNSVTSIVDNAFEYCI